MHDQLDSFFGHTLHTDFCARLHVMHYFPFADVDECSRGLHGCEGECRDTDGSYECSCSPGLRLSDNGRDCTGTYIIQTHTWDMQCYA